MTQSKPSILVIAGSHGGQLCGPVIHQRLLVSGVVEPTLHNEPLALGPADFQPYDVVLYYGENSHERRDFSDEAEMALREYVRGGKGFVGVHVASYRAAGRLEDLIGGNSPGCVPAPEALPRVNRIQWEFDVHVADPTHPVTAGVQDFRIIDEHYRSTVAQDVHVLLRGDEELGHYPLAWVRREGRGRVFHTPLGHRPDGFGEPQFWRLILQGIRWVAAPD
jgi:type 1 glutamine amidotransferase